MSPTVALGDVLLLQILTRESNVDSSTAKIFPNKCCLPVGVTFVKNYSVQLFLKITEPFSEV